MGVVLIKDGTTARKSADEVIGEIAQLERRLRSTKLPDALYRVQRSIHRAAMSWKQAILDSTVTEVVVRSNGEAVTLPITQGLRPYSQSSSPSVRRRL